MVRKIDLFSITVEEKAVSGRGWFDLRRGLTRPKAEEKTFEIRLRRIIGRHRKKTGPQFPLFFFLKDGGGYNNDAR